MGRSYTKYTAFHFHNFFPNLEDLRFKYFSYGHPDKKALLRPLRELGGDIEMLVNCVQNSTNTSDASNQHIPGGLRATKPFWPIYFHDEDYRAEKHAQLTALVEEDIEKHPERDEETAKPKKS